jgi:transposase-like protein
MFEPPRVCRRLQLLRGWSYGTEEDSEAYSPEVRARAVWMVTEHQGEHASQWAAICSIAAKIGCSGETLRGWVRQAERDEGSAGGHDQRDACSFGGGGRFPDDLTNLEGSSRTLLSRHYPVSRRKRSVFAICAGRFPDERSGTCSRFAARSTAACSSTVNTASTRSAANIRSIFARPFASSIR